MKGKEFILGVAYGFLLGVSLAAIRNGKGRR